MSRLISRSIRGLVSLATVAAFSAMPLCAASFGAGGANSPHVLLVRGGGGGGFSGGGRGFSGGGFSGMHSVGGFAGGRFPLMSMGGNGHSGNSAAASTPSGSSRFSPRVTGGGTHTRMTTPTTTPMTTRPPSLRIRAAAVRRLWIWLSVL